MKMDINSRQNQLTHLQNYLKEVDAEVTMILQNFQWDRKQLTERKGMITCSYDTNHRVPPDKLLKHEKGCFLKSQGYIEGDRFLPSPMDADAPTLVKLSADNIMQIINNASQHQPLFHKVPIGSFGCDRIKYNGAGCRGPQPLTLERLQATYSADQRRAIHDAVVHQVPSCHDLSDLALLSSNNEVGKETKTKSKLEILAELRDMRRRRTKYRVAAKTRNYSDVLRDVITTQMELYSQTHTSIGVTQMKSSIPDCESKAKHIPKDNSTTRYDNENSNRSSHSTERQTLSVKDASNKSRHFGQQEEYEKRKRGHINSDRDYNYSSGYSKTRYHMDYGKSRSRNDADDFQNANRKRHLDHDHYDSRNRYSGKESCNNKKTAAEEHTLNSTSDKRKATCNDYSKRQDRHYGYEKYYSSRVKPEPDQYRNTELSSRSKSDVHREKRYEHKQPQNQTARMKKEKDDYSDDDDSSSSEDTEDSNSTSYNSEKHYSGVKKIKVENDDTLKRKGNNESDDHSRKYGSKHSQTFYETQQSKVSYNKHSTSTRYNEKYKQYEKYKERTSRDIGEQESRETAREKIKVERDRIYNKTMDTDEHDRNTRIAYSRHYHDWNERDRSRGDKYTMDKTEDKQKTYRKY